jgi:dipeptidyl aminopeptidase/acylaminoacyl peptidase
LNERRRLGASEGTIANVQRTLERLIGGPLEENEGKLRRANPIAYARAGAPPFLIVHGDQDQVVPLASARWLQDALAKVNTPASLHVLGGVGHDVWYWDYDSLATEFLDRYLRGAKP